MLLLDLRRSISLGGGGGLDEEFDDRTRSFSIGGGGLSESGDWVDSGRRGRSGCVARMMLNKSIATIITTYHEHLIFSKSFLCSSVDRQSMENAALLHQPL